MAKHLRENILNLASTSSFIKELIYRKYVFLQNQVKIANHNKLYESGQSLYFQAHNLFSDLTSEEFISYYTWKRSPY